MDFRKEGDHPVLSDKVGEMLCWSEEDDGELERTLELLHFVTQSTSHEQSLKKSSSQAGEREE
jgi:hypothetical protein